MSIAVGIKKVRAINKGKSLNFSVKETKKIRKMLAPIKEAIDLLYPPKVNKKPLVRLTAKRVVTKKIKTSVNAGVLFKAVTPIY
ncbi:hypothetical protein N9361_00175 [Alphaproteobacteria bacterium]|nr:hypothetical protein [Alphaproteobacteria bacterium]